MLGRGVGLVVGVTGDTSGLKSALGSAGQDVKGFGGISLATAAKVTVIGGAVVLAAEALWSLGKAADADRTEQAKLIKVFEQAGAATGNYTAIIDAAILAGQNKAFTDSESRAALEALVTATGDAGKAAELHAVAMDVARFAGVSLEQAANAIAKAEAGQDGALRKLIPGLAKGAKATDTIALASKRAAGQADIFANSSEGGAMRTADAMGELGETVGEVVLPVMDALIPIVIDIIRAITPLIKAALPILVGLLKVVATVFGKVGDAIGMVVGWVQGLVNWFQRAIKWVGEIIDALSALNPFGGLISAITGGINATGGTATGGPGGSFNATFNIYGRDPAAVEATIVRVLNDYSRRNGFAVMPVNRA